jgi:hypothetical protein
MQWVTAAEDCIVIGLESFPMGSSVWVAGNTVYAQKHTWAGCMEAVYQICASRTHLLLQLLLIPSDFTITFKFQATMP